MTLDLQAVMPPISLRRCWISKWFWFKSQGKLSFFFNKILSFPRDSNCNCCIICRHPSLIGSSIACQSKITGSSLNKEESFNKFIYFENGLSGIYRFPACNALSVWSLEVRYNKVLCTYLDIKNCRNTF